MTPQQQALVAMKRLQHLNLCDLEGLHIGQPTKTDWRRAFDALDHAIDNLENNPEAVPVNNLQLAWMQAQLDATLKVAAFLKDKAFGDTPWTAADHNEYTALMSEAQRIARTTPNFDRSSLHREPLARTIEDIINNNQTQQP